MEGEEEREGRKGEEDRGKEREMGGMKEKGWQGLKVAPPILISKSRRLSTNDTSSLITARITV